MCSLLLEAELADVGRYVKNGGQEKLFSYTFKIDAEQSARFLQLYHAAKGKKFYLNHPSSSGMLAGFEVIRTFSSEDPERRFIEIQEKWKDCLEGADVHNPYHIPGTGPLLFGGFSFDPQSVKEDIWKDFQDSLFFLPKYMLAVHNGSMFLTVNLLCGKDTEEGTLLETEQFLRGLAGSLDETPMRAAAVTVSREADTEKWKEAVRDVVNILKLSDVKKVVLARKLLLDFSEPADSKMVIDRLLEQQPDSYIFALEAGNSRFIGASPERLVKKTGNEVLSACVAGSIARGSSKEEDEKLGQALLRDGKNRYEHKLVVDMIKNAIEPFCTEINLKEQPGLMKIRDIQHLFTPVSGKMRQGCSILDVAEALHPTPAMGGVPTGDALRIIRECEGMDRGFYAAPIGWFDYQGNGEFFVAIRSGLFLEKRAVLYAGCGLVADSTPEDELIETRIKFRPMLRAAGGELK